ncbi:hypothetical protein [Streptomyces sp. NBC_01304]|uniref:hypothetical protein n=1 Tax=Streptomyces sp. NBC_01304 TaxID=2903818 RepID=UPI002E0E3367|nr:hypothetical protein OG430_14605 [Streptomyces sp. NBC_01304]
MDVRPKDGRGRTELLDREDALNSSLVKLVCRLLATAFATGLALETTGFRPYFWGTAAALTLTGALRVAGRMNRGRNKAATRAATILLAFALLLATGGSPLADDSGPSQTQALFTVVLAVAVTGLCLLVRQWSWSGWVVWGGSIVVGLVVAPLAASGLVLHQLYADELGLAPGDVDVPGLWQPASATRLLLAMALIFVIPWALRSPAETAEAAEQAAQTGMQPPPYFGIEPTWACIVPTVPLDELSTQGGTIDPRRPTPIGAAPGDCAKAEHRRARECRAAAPGASIGRQLANWQPVRSRYVVAITAAATGHRAGGRIRPTR